MNTSLTVNLVVENGQVNEEATLQAFAGQLSQYVADSKIEAATIGDTVDAIFTQYNGQNIKMPDLASFVAMRLHATPSNMQSLKDRALDYVRANSKGDNSLFVIGKGPKDGGVRRRSDLAPAAPVTK